MKNIYFILSISLFFTFNSLYSFSSKPTVLVSIPPHKQIVKRIAEEHVEVLSIVPAGADPHSFEPTPRQTAEASHAKLWFQMGEGFEEKALSAFQSHRSDLKVVDLRNGIDIIDDHSHGHHHHCNCHQDGDPHIWMSPKELQIQSKTVAQALISLDPENRELYTLNLNKLLAELKLLDREVEGLLKDRSNRTLAVSHPALGYFCRDYGFHQLSIEHEGRSPSPKQLTKILAQLKEKKVKTIYAIANHNLKGAHLIASAIDGKVVLLDPLEEDLIENIRATAQKIKESN